MSTQHQFKHRYPKRRRSIAILLIRSTKSGSFVRRLAESSFSHLDSLRPFRPGNPRYQMAWLTGATSRFKAQIVAILKAGWPDFQRRGRRRVDALMESARQRFPNESHFSTTKCFDAKEWSGRISLSILGATVPTRRLRRSWSMRFMLLFA